MRRNRIIKSVLIPFSLAYSGVMSIRNFFYDIKLFSSDRKKIPVISVGNITTGGTGKSPMTIWIADYLIGKNRKVAVISRGYKRRTTKPVIVCDGARILLDVSQSGDELMMISEELLRNHKGKFVVAAGADRSEAIDTVLREFDADVIVLDDAFQHRKLWRNLDILLVNAEEYFCDSFSHKFTIPSGNLRECISGINRADLIIQNNKGSNLPDVPFIGKSGKVHLTLRYNSEYFVDEENVILHHLDKKVILFSGLADNESFFISAMNTGIEIVDNIGFGDHHEYTEADFDRITQNYSGKEIFVTTHKDFIKIVKVGKFTDEFDLCYLKISLKVEADLTNLTNKIDKAVGI